MAEQHIFYMRTNVAALEKLGKILAAHGIQITNVLRMEYDTPGMFASGVNGIPPGVHPKLTVELFVPMTEAPVQSEASASESGDVG